MASGIADCLLADRAVLPHGGEWAAGGGCWWAAPLCPPTELGSCPRALHPCCWCLLPARATQRGPGTIPDFCKLQGERERVPAAVLSWAGLEGGGIPAPLGTLLKVKPVKPGPCAASGPGTAVLLLWQQGPACLCSVSPASHLPGPAAMGCRQGGLPTLVPVPCPPAGDEGAAWTSPPQCPGAVPGARAPRLAGRAQPLPWCPRCFWQPRACSPAVRRGVPKPRLGVWLQGAGEAWLSCCGGDVSSLAWKGHD